MDAYAGYNQIKMDPGDEEHTAFTTDRGLYCYKVMAFGLKNAGATYQRFMNVMFAEYLGKIMEVYVDDMLVKSLIAEEHVGHLKKVFEVILRYGMRLNPQKCIFRVTKGKFLGHIINRRGIEANPEKIQAILDMERPTKRNEVQSLAGKIVAFVRLVSRLTDKCAPFFRLLKDQRCKEIIWGPEQEEAFKQIKAYLTSATVLSKSIPGEMLYLYIAASRTAVSSVLIRKESNIEHAMFYAGNGFTPVESRYPDVEKLALTLIVTAKRLRHYFQAHSITLYTNYPLRQIMQKPDINGRLVKWAIDLGEFDIHYRLRIAIKGQTAADFIFELMPMKMMGESSELTPVKVVGESSEVGREESYARAAAKTHSEDPPAPLWKLFVDGSVTRNKSGTRIILETPDGFKHEYALEFQFKTSNNAAEYEALIGGLQLAGDIGVENVEVFSDSQLVVNQVNGSFIAKEPQLNSYQVLSKFFMHRFKSASLSHIPRKENSNEDALAWLTTGGPGKGRKKARIEVLGSPSISKTISEIFMVEAGPGEPTWMNPIVEFMKEGVRPEDKRQARKLQSRCAKYTRMNEKLYRRGYSFPNLKCVTEKESEAIMGEIHEGVCRNHSRSWSLAHKALRTGFF
ncbi:PREDICTED: uncharacterized protein LOC101308660 [Fragaria vesca subsp. vesca]